MSAYPTSATGLNYISYPQGPTTASTTLTANASNNTKGSYVQMVASSPFAVQNVITTANATTNTNNLHYLIDLATGAAASEVVVIANLTLSHFGTTTGAVTPSWQVPLAIANGTRIAMRCQCSTGSSTVNVAVTLVDSNGAPGLTSTVTTGPATGTSLAVSVDPGGTADTKGSYSEVVTSTASAYQWLMLMTHDFGHNSAQGAIWCLDVATGGSGSEVVLIPDLRVRMPSTWLIAGLVSYSVLTYIASSTRIACRASCSINTATSRLIDVGVVTGVAPSEPSGASGGAWAFA